MKKILNTIAVVLTVAAAASCDMFKLDNFDGPNAQIAGRLLDAETGDLIGIEATYSSEIDWANVDWSTWTFPTITVSKGAIIVNELGWKDKEGNEVYDDQRWYIRFDGRYRNDLIFAGDYRYFMRELPCYESEDNTFTAKKGSNNVDLRAIPFCRVGTPEFQYDDAAKKLRVTVAVTLGDDTKANEIQNILFCGNTQLFVGGNYFNLVNYDQDPAAKKAQGYTFDMATYTLVTTPAAQPGQAVTLEIDCDPNGPNKELFKYNQDRYFRIAAQAGGNGYNGNSLYNFSAIYKASNDFSKIEEYKWSE